MKQLLLNVLFFFLIFIAKGQVQIGNDINGSGTNDDFGHRVSLSDDGTLLAIGAPNSDDNAVDSGSVKVYQNNNGVWTQVGNTLYGVAESDFFGIETVLSGDGSTLAIGAPGNDTNGDGAGLVQIYENVNGNWTQIGTDIFGEAALDFFGENIGLSTNGTIIAIAAADNDGNGNDSGNVRVFENVNGVWTQIGNNINGDTGSFLGRSIDISGDGNIIAIGAPNSDINADNIGVVKVYENTNGAWTQVGGNIVGEAENDFSGRSVSISENGNRVAIGADFNNGNGNFSGHTRVFENSNGNWIQIGNDIDGEANGDFSGRSISLSNNGDVLAIGATGNDGGGNSSGHVRIFQDINGTWTQIGTDIDGDADNDAFGFHLNLSGDGNFLSIGSPLHDNNNVSNTGLVRVYSLNTVLSTDSFNKDYFNVVVNHNNNTIEINLISEHILKQVNLYNIYGQYLYSVKSHNLSTAGLSSGVYIVEAETTNKEKSAKKIILK